MVNRNGTGAGDGDLRRRVVVTGMGAVTPVGNTVAEYWQGLISGCNGIDTITMFDPHRLGVQIAVQTKGFDPEGHLGRKEARRMDRFSQFAVVAAREAAAVAGLQLGGSNGDRAGVMSWYRHRRDHD